MFAGGGMKIRKYQEKDKGSVKKLIRKVLKEICGLNPKQLDGRLKDLENIKNNFDVFFVAEDKEKIIGTVGLVKEEKDFALTRLYVGKSYRRKGVAKKLCDKIENFCQNRGIKKIILSTTTEMESAINFYLKIGYKKINQIKIAKEGKKYNVIFMEKKIR